jgi:hypothetical protein
LVDGCFESNNIYYLQDKLVKLLNKYVISFNMEQQAFPFELVADKVFKREIEKLYE